MKNALEDKIMATVNYSQKGTLMDRIKKAWVKLNR
jgi:hypothetical protein